MLNYGYDQNIFPTGVGVNRISVASDSLILYIPHRRGGEPVNIAQVVYHGIHIPHRRGGEPGETPLTTDFAAYSPQAWG